VCGRLGGRGERTEAVALPVVAAAEPAAHGAPEAAAAEREGAALGGHRVRPEVLRQELPGARHELPTRHAGGGGNSQGGGSECSPRLTGEEEEEGERGEGYFST
jgi:hypothetical protein